MFIERERLPAVDVPTRAVALPCMIVMTHSLVKRILYVALDCRRLQSG